MHLISSLFRYAIQSFILLVISFFVLIADNYYYTEQPLNAPRNYVFPIFLAICTLELLLDLTKNWNLVLRSLAVLICAFQVQQMIAFEKQLDRKKFLHKAYVVDFSYDKYCNLSGEDKWLLEEISIYGYTDCDDAKIHYKKIMKNFLWWFRDMGCIVGEIATEFWRGWLAAIDCQASNSQSR